MQRFKTIRPVLAIALSVGLVAGCAGRSTGSDPSSEGAAGADGPTTLKVMTILYGNPPAETNNEAKADIEKRGNVKLDIEFVPADAYADKLSVAVASDTGYDLMLFEGRSDKYVNLARQGAFHDLTPYLKGKDNLNYMPEAIWKNSMVQGKAYGVPRPRGLYGGGEASFLLRKDWLDKLNLKVPTTLDEMTQVLRAFRDNDPAGGGKTIPMVAFARDEHVFGATSAIFYPFGVPNYYTIENGTPKYLIQTEGYKRYLEWLRMAYAEKLIDKDAPILKQQQAREKFYAGIAGAFVFHVGGLNDANYDLLRKSAPGAELVVVPPLEGPAGRRASVESGYFGLWVIPSSVPKAKVEKIVEFLNFSASEENFIFSKTGVIGVHSSEFKNGIAVQTEEQRKKMTADVPSAFVLENRYDPYNYAGSSDPEINKYQKEMLDMLEKVEGVPNPFSSYNSTTAAQNPDHLKSFSAVALKYVVGEVGWDAVQNEIDKWEKTYGTKILNEMMEQYKRDQQ